MDTETIPRMDPNDAQIIAARLSDTLKEVLNAPKKRGPHFDATINLGHILTALTLGLTVIAALMFQARTDQRQDGTLTELEGRVLTVEETARSNRESLNSLQETNARLDERTKSMVEGIDRIERKIEDGR